MLTTSLALAVLLSHSAAAVLFRRSDISQRSFVEQPPLARAAGRSGLRRYSARLPDRMRRRRRDRSPCLIASCDENGFRFARRMATRKPSFALASATLSHRRFSRPHKTSRSISWPLRWSARSRAREVKSILLKGPTFATLLYQDRRSSDIHRRRPARRRVRCFAEPTRCCLGRGSTHGFESREGRRFPIVSYGFVPRTRSISITRFRA